MVGVAAEDVLDVEHLEGHASCCDYDGEQVVDLGLFVLYAADLFAVALAVLFACDETQLGGNCEVAQRHQQHLLQDALRTIAFQLLQIFVAERHNLHRIANRKVFELFLQNVVPLRPLLAVLRLLPQPQVVSRCLQGSIVVFYLDAVVHARRQND